jgi:hypothetical protein
MTAQQRTDHRQIYNQLRLAIAFPGDTVGETRKAYAPVDKWALTWDELMATPDTPAIARYRATRETSMWCAVGVH